MTYDSYFATQYKDYFVFCGIQTGTGVATTTDQGCVLSGCITDVNREDGYVWSALPHLSVQLCNDNSTVQSLQLCGGYTCGEEIKVFGTIYRIKRRYKLKTIKKCWNTCLTMPFSQWSESTSSIIALSPHVKVPPIAYLVAVRKCKQYVIYFYSPQKSCESDAQLSSSASICEHEVSNTLLVNNEEENQSCLLSIDSTSVTFDGFVSCTVVGADLFIVSGDKMAKVEKITHLLVASARADQSTTFSISFDLRVPHANGTLFVVQDTLCVVGGCDDNYEPFSEIYQFDQETHKWNECGGRRVMARYGASVVTFTDRKDKEAVFIAGGFKGIDIPCSVIELLDVSVRPA